MNQTIQVDHEIGKAGHRSPFGSCASKQLAATGRRKHTQVAFLWITLRFWQLTAIPINSARLDASILNSIIERRGRTCATPSNWRFSMMQTHSGRPCIAKQLVAGKRRHGASNWLLKDTTVTCGQHLKKV